MAEPMKTHDPQNERIKRRYLTFLKEARRRSEASIDIVASSLHRFERYNNYRDFRKFHIQQAIGFKAHLVKETNARTGAPLSKATLLTTVSAVKAFFQWLSEQQSYRSLKYVDADYFDLSEKDIRVARAHREQPVPTMEQIRRVIARMPTRSEIERRNRALLAFTILTGARDGAIASFKLKHIDIAEGRVDHDAREVRSKASKTFTTYFFPVGDDLREIVVEWVAYLRTVALWRSDDPVFPAPKVAQGAMHQFEIVGIDRKHWRNAEPIRKIFRTAFERAEIPYANPHSFRKTLARLGEQVCHTPEEFKAWSQNLGHEHVMTTLTSYGEVSRERQAEILRELANVGSQPEGMEEAEMVLKAAMALLRRRASGPDGRSRLTEEQSLPANDAEERMPKQ
jgi:integrase/recombinase XerD